MRPELSSGEDVVEVKLDVSEDEFGRGKRSCRRRKLRTRGHRGSVYLGTAKIRENRNVSESTRRAEAVWIGDYYVQVAST